MIRRLFNFATLLGLILSTSSTAFAEHEEEIALIKKQFCEYQLVPDNPDARPLSQVTDWMNSLTPEGSWKDINYENQEKGAWLTMNHLNRLHAMCRAYASPQSPLHGDPGLAKAIHSALGYWLQKDYRNPNWWYNIIGVPREISTILLLLDSEISPQERAAGIQIISRSVLDSPPQAGHGVLTGENRVWVAENVLTRGLLASDFALVQKGRDVIFEEVSIATQPGGVDFARATGLLVPIQEGIQPDYSFFQHGSLLQLGNYGLAFAGDIAQWMTILRGTDLAQDPDKVAILRDYLLKGSSTVVWKGAMDISSCGRQIGPRAPKGKATALLRVLNQMKIADAAHAAAYQTAIGQIGPDATASVIPSRNTYFWRADYMVHQRPGYYLSTKMSSTRVLAAELVNGENLQGAYLADGATYLYQTGHEYEDIFPVWDWSRLPGVTCPEITDKSLLKPKTMTITNLSNFVGGVTDGHYGATVLDLNRDGLTAKKGWFYFDDQIVCLGAGISCEKDALPITTSVNQCLARGDLIVDAGQGTATPPAGLQEYSQLKWACHDQVGYIFPEPQNITLGCQDQTGGWNEITARNKPDPVTKNVFSIWINHGVKPQNAHYSYLILPGASPATLQAQASAPDVQILANTPALQAVRHPKLKLTQAIFYQPGSLPYADGKTIAVDQPCILLLDENKKSLTMADPTQKLTGITVTLNGTAKKYALPTGPKLGSSITQVLE